MQRTWRLPARARSRAPTARAVWPPTPASTSSKTSVPPGEAAPATLITASITRESSPPEAISRTGAAGTPGLGAIRNSTVSAPQGPGSRSPSATSKLAPAIASSASCSPTALAKVLAAAVRAARSPSAQASSSAIARASSTPLLCSASSAPASSAWRARACSANASTAAMLPPCLRARRSSRVKRSSRASSAGSAPSARASGALEVGAQLAREVARLDHERAHAPGERVQARVHAGVRLHLRERRGGQRGGAGRALLPVPFRVRALGGLRRQRGEAGGRGAEQCVAHPHSLSRCQQALVLALVGGGLIDLGELVLEQVELPLAFAGELYERTPALLQSAHAGVRLRAAMKPRSVVALADPVEDLQLAGGDRQLAVLVLAVEGEQARADVAQLADGRGAAGEIGTRAPVAAHAAR